MESKTADLLRGVAAYYSGKLAAHGLSPQGVDWNGEESQVQRFRQLLTLVRPTRDFSLNDLGCGHGELFAFLTTRCENFRYRGFDISGDMIDAAAARFRTDAHASFHVAAAPTDTADYGVASGIFNVCMDNSPATWHAHLLATLDAINETSTRGFAFNCLSSYSDPEYRRAHLYYADPLGLFDLCKRRYAPHVSLLHDYGLHDFTIVVRKTS
jgi:SAM-dependent methyltransferase